MMELKVWMEGHQRIVCGVTEQTTCQDVMIALAHATGKTGRYAMFEKWRANERCLSPTDYPLLILQKWGEYSGDIQFILHHSNVDSSSAKNKKSHPKLNRVLEFGPPEKASIKKSLTFSGAHKWSCSIDHPASPLDGCSRNVCHSVESSEHSSVASQSSASLSPYTSLERQPRAYHQSKGYSERDELYCEAWSQIKLEASAGNSVRLNVAENRSPVVVAHPRNRSPQVPHTKGQPPTASPRTSKMSSSVGKSGNKIPRPAPNPRKEMSQISENDFRNEVVSEKFRGKSPSTLVTCRDFDFSLAQQDSTGETLVKIEKIQTPTQPARPRALEHSTSGQKHLQKEADGIPRTKQMFVGKQTSFKKENAGTSVGEIPPTAKPVGSYSSPVLEVSPVSFSNIRNARSGEELSAEAVKKKELIQLIGQQEDEIQKCEQRLRDLTYEISLLEGNLDVDEKQLDSELRRIEELEDEEKEIENELEELEIVSWEDKLALERQKESRIRTEIFLLQSSIAKSESEIESFVEKIESLTAKTEEATKELNGFLEEKKGEHKDIVMLEANLSETFSQSKSMESVIGSLESEIRAADQSLSKKKVSLADLESQLKKLNMDIFLQDPAAESTSTRTGKNSVFDRLCLSRPGSSQRLDRGPLRLNEIAEESRNDRYGYVV